MLLLKGLKLLLIAVAVLLAMLLMLLAVAMIIDKPQAALVILIPAVIGGMLLAGIVMSASITIRRRRGANLLNYLEQAVRLNLPLPRVVGAIADSERGRFAADLRNAREALEAGQSLATVLAVVPNVPPRVIGLVAAAERGGRLPQVLSRLMQQRRTAFTRPLGFMPFYRTYPLVLMLTLITVTSLIMVFVMPKFQQIFKDFGVDLPPITRFIFITSRTIGPWIAILIATILIALIFNSIIARWYGAAYGVAEGWGARVANILPWIGPMRMHRALGEVMEFAADSIESGRPMDVALAEAGQVSANSRLRKRMDTWVSAMRAGQSPDQAARIAGMPKLVSGMLATSLHTADVAEVFRFMGRYYTSRFSRALTMLEAALEPAITIVMGLIVAAVVLGLFAPLVSLIQAVSYPTSARL